MEKDHKFNTCKYRSKEPEYHGTRCGACPNLSLEEYARKVFFCYRRGIEIDIADICAKCSMYHELVKED